jgi:N-methylhydantoinase A
MPGVEVARTVFARPTDGEVLRGALRALASEAGARLRAQGVKARAWRVTRFADLRYAGQSHEITVPYGPRMVAAFLRAHEERYGHLRAGAPIEVVTLRLRAAVPDAPRRSAGAAPLSLFPGAPHAAGGNLSGEDASGTFAFGPRTPQPGAHARGTRERVFAGGRWILCPVVPREDLAAVRALAGPVRVTEYSATTFVPEGWTVRAGRFGVMVIARSARGRKERSHRSASIATRPRVGKEGGLRSRVRGRAPSRAPSRAGGSGA